MTKRWYDLHNQLKPLYENYAFLQFAEEQIQNGITPKTESFNVEVILRTLLAVGGLHYGIPKIGTGREYRIHTTLFKDGTRNIVVNVDGTTSILSEKDLLSPTFITGLGATSRDAVKSIFPGLLLRTVMKGQMYLTECRPQRSGGEGLIIPVATAESSILTVSECISITRMAIQLYEQWRHVSSANKRNLTPEKALELAAKSGRSIIVEPYVQTRGAPEKPVTFEEFEDATIDAILKEGTLKNAYQHYLRSFGDKKEPALKHDF